MAISDIISKNMGNLTGGGLVGIAGGIAGSIFSSSASNSAKNAADAQILNKSPLELNNQKPTAHMEQNPYQFATTYYPNEVQNLGSGNYMIFDILQTETSSWSLGGQRQGGGNQLMPTNMNDLSEDALNTIPGATSKTQSSNYITGANYTAAQNRITIQSSGIDAGQLGGRYTRVVNTIVLYTPPAIKTSYNVTHESVDTGIIGNLLGKGVAINSVGDFLAAAGTSVSNVLEEIVSQGLQIIPGVGDLKGALTKLNGRAINPHTEMVFKGVPMREFDYTFEFAPKNPEELKRMQEILFLFRYHMHPELAAGNDFIVPSEFQITYMYLDNRNSYIPRISKCVLKTMDIQHGDESVFSTFVADENGAAPVYTKMTLKFAETEIMTKTTINRGF